MERQVVVAVPEGLHARPAALFASEAARQPVAVTVRLEDGAPVAAASILGVMTLGVGLGDTVVLETESDDEAARGAIDALAAILERPEPA